MKVKTFEAEYDLVEFNHYIDYTEETGISVIDIVIKADIKYAQEEFDDMFIIETEKLSYVFSGYEMSECYEVGGNLIRVICVK